MKTVVLDSYQQKNYYLKEIESVARLFHELKTDKQVLIKWLNDLSKDRVLKIGTRYEGNSGPVNSLRGELAKLLNNSETITLEFIDKRIQEIEAESGRSSFKSYDYFSILFPFLQIGIEFNVKEALTELSSEIMTRLKLSKIAKIHAVDFWGPRGFGDDRAWIAIFNNTHRNQQTAKQLLINIDNRGLNCRVYNRSDQTFLDEKHIEINAQSVNEIVKFLESFVEQIRQDDYSKASFFPIGVNGAKFYKLSHGELFTQEQIQECLDANIAVVHETTGPKGKTPFLQYDTFANAKKGDLFYNCWGNNQLLMIGQFIDDEVRDYSLNGNPHGWKERSYRILVQVQIVESYRGPKKKWSPNDSSTFVEVPTSDYELINEIILRPYFQAELDPEKSMLIPEDKVGVSSQQGIKVLDGDVSPRLDVKIVAQEFANIIDNLEDNKGQMLGVFGSWGRGKTFFVDCVKEEFKLNEGEKEKYINVTFNAWKYQETEAIWAYLYEVILDTYHADKVKENAWSFKKKLIAKKRTFFLNFKRKGYSKFFGIFVSFIASIVIAYVISSSIKWDFANYLVTAVGAIGLIQAFLLYKRYYQGIKDVLNDYSSRHSYRSLLGLQAEIQDELIVLIKHWLKEKDERRIVLFVDDLDRCNEDKIIQIIDALRVLLDDDYLVQKLIIIVAVDELLLERAIQLKYKEFKVEKEEKNLVQEYMDKLFIAGIKFPSLNVDEQAIILENYAVKGNILEQDIVYGSDSEGADESASVVVSEETSAEFVFPEPELIQSKIVKSEFFLLRSELEMLQEFSNKISTNVTPRGLRIYMYRYLLSKNLASVYMTKSSRYQLGDNECLILAKAIANKSSNSSFSVIEMEEMKSVDNQQLKEFIPKLIEMVVPY